jgi:hypothetical protein
MTAGLVTATVCGLLLDSPNVRVSSFGLRRCAVRVSLKQILLPRTKAEALRPSELAENTADVCLGQVAPAMRTRDPRTRCSQLGLYSEATWRIDLTQVASNRERARFQRISVLDSRMASDHGSRSAGHRRARPN